jgi:cobalt-zinc-cadmium efflux system membrane fusion protein
MKKSLPITLLIVTALAVASYFVLRTEPNTAGEESDHAEHAEEAGGHDETEPHADQDEHAGEDANSSAGRITFHDDAPIWQTLRLATAGPGDILLEIELPGEIALNADKVAHIVPRFPGIALEVYKNLGDKVREREVLAVVQSNESVSPYDVKSLVSGTIIEKHITLGEFVRDDADVFVVADLSTVWAKISVYAKYLPTVKPGAKVRLTANGIDQVAECTIDYVGPIVGERTRTGIARAILPNPENIWQPGLFVSAKVVVDDISVSLAVPDDAIQTINDKPVVFVKEGREFEVRPVTLGRSDGRTVEILAGLKPGEEYVAADSYIFKAEFGKSEAGHGH